MNGLYHAGEAVHSGSGDRYGITDSVVHFDVAADVNAHLCHFFLGEGSGLRAGTDKTGGTADIFYHMPCIICVNHFQKDIARKQLAFQFFCFSVCDFCHRFGGDLNF